MTPSALYVVRLGSACGRWLLRLAVAAAVIAVIGGLGVGLVRTQDRLDGAPALNAAIQVEPVKRDAVESVMRDAVDTDPVLSAKVSTIRGSEWVGKPDCQTAGRPVRSRP